MLKSRLTWHWICQKHFHSRASAHGLIAQVIMATEKLTTIQVRQLCAAPGLICMVILQTRSLRLQEHTWQQATINVCNILLVIHDEHTYRPTYNNHMCQICREYMAKHKKLKSPALNNTDGVEFETLNLSNTCQIQQEWVASHFWHQYCKVTSAYLGLGAGKDRSRAGLVLTAWCLSSIT